VSEVVFAEVFPIGDVEAARCQCAGHLLKSEVAPHKVGDDFLQGAGFCVKQRFHNFLHRLHDYTQGKDQRHDGSQSLKNAHQCLPLAASNRFQGSNTLKNGPYAGAKPHGRERRIQPFWGRPSPLMARNPISGITKGDREGCESYEFRKGSKISNHLQAVPEARTKTVSMKNRDRE
jgi:hypothetical protein